MGIRSYRPSDFERLEEITIRCFPEVSIDRNIEQRLGTIGGHDWRWRKLRQIEADLQPEHAPGVFVWEEDDQVVGYVTTRVDTESRIGWIPNLSVLPAYQRRGIGRELLQAALDHLRDQGMECAKIETLEQNEVGTRFYPRLGFQEVARQIYFIKRL